LLLLLSFFLSPFSHPGLTHIIILDLFSSPYAPALIYSVHEACPDFEARVEVDSMSMEPGEEEVEGGRWESRREECRHEIGTTVYKRY